MKPLIHMRSAPQSISQCKFVKSLTSFTLLYELDSFGNLRIIASLTHSTTQSGLSRRCAVVGNSGDLFDHAHGAEIDGFDTVIRFNAAPTRGYVHVSGSSWYLNFYTFVFLCCTSS